MDQWPEHTLVSQSVQLLSRVQLFATPWTAAHRASLSFTSSRSSLRLMSAESVMPSNHLILCCPLLLLPSIFPSIRVFSNESALASGGQSIRASASASVLPVNIQVLFPLGLKSLKSSSAFSKMKRSLVFADRLGGFSSVFLVVLLSTVRPPSLRPFEGCLINVFC